MRTNFITELDSDVYDTSRNSLQLGSAKVHWSIDFETREYGIKSIYITPKRLTGVLSWEISRPLSGGDYEITYTDEDLDLDLIENPEWEVIERVETCDGSIAPVHVEIDFDRKEITIS